MTEKWLLLGKQRWPGRQIRRRTPETGSAQNNVWMKGS
jgi:hypothetical protein